MIGLKLKVPPAAFADAALERRLLLIPAGDNVVHVVPPLVVTDEEIAEGVRRKIRRHAHRDAGGPIHQQVGHAGEDSGSDSLSS